MKRTPLYWYALAIAMMCGSSLHASPIVPGYERLRQSKDSSASLRGEVLLGELNCISCHSADQAVRNRIPTRKAPDLRTAHKRMTPQYLRAFLMKPHGLKDGTVMPDIFHASEDRSKAGAVDFLVNFIMGLGEPAKAVTYAGSKKTISEGKKLFETIGCQACHEPTKQIDSPVPSVPLGNLAMKTTVPELAKFLKNPHSVRASGRMPSLRLADEEAHAIAMYLLRDQVTTPDKLPSESYAYANGLEFEYFTGRAGLPLSDHAKQLKSRATGTVPGFTLNLPVKKGNRDIAIRYKGAIQITEPGIYLFWGSASKEAKLYINGELAADLAGRKKVANPVELEIGFNELELEYRHDRGGMSLSFEWEGPDTGDKKVKLPANVLFHKPAMPMLPTGTQAFRPLRQQAMMGKQMFSMLRCAACHDLGIKPMRPGKPLADLNLQADQGCLGDNIRRGLPNYFLSKEQRSDILAALTDVSALSKPLPIKDQVTRTMAALNCYACHDRDGVGGVDDAHNPLFGMTQTFDLGDEGRIPPTLTGIGAKLKRSALEGVLYHGQSFVRPYMATRMPAFGNQALEGLVDAIEEADKVDTPKSPGEFSKEAVAAGHRIVGITGVGCINCHNVRGVKSPGIPAVDLATVSQRIKPDWFQRFLADPVAFKGPNTRMPAFWKAGKILPDVAGGQAESQIASIWHYLSLGNSMPLPKGMILKNDGYELVPVDEPIVFRTFMKDVSPRAITVGYPESLNVAFDANKMRLAKVWRGAFFDAKGTWAGRAGGFSGPMGVDVIDMPTGPSFAALGNSDDPWPNPDMKDRNTGGRFKGYSLNNAGQPTFRYELQDVSIEETPLPEIQPGGSALVRQFKLSNSDNRVDLYFIAAEGGSIEEAGKGQWKVDSKQVVTVNTGGGPSPSVRKIDGKSQLIAPVVFENNQASFEVKIQW